MLRSNHVTRTASTTEPVSVEALRIQARIDDDEDDGDLKDMLSEARLECETALGDVSLIDATCVDYFDRFGDEMELHWSPVDSITTVQYVDANGTAQTLASTYYELGVVNGMGVLRLKYGQSWPTTRDHADAVIVTYKAGFGAAASDVPSMIRRWIKARAAWLYANRDGEEYPFVFNGLLIPYSTRRVFG